MQWSLIENVVLGVFADLEDDVSFEMKKNAIALVREGTRARLDMASGHHIQRQQELQQVLMAVDEMRRGVFLNGFARRVFNKWY